MANTKNLRPIKKGELSREEAKRRGSKGGQASVESRRKSKYMKEVLDYLLEKEIKKKNSNETGTTLEAILTAMVMEAMDGNVRAAEFIRATIGQDPEENHVIKGVGFNITVGDNKHKEMLEDL